MSVFVKICGLSSSEHVTAAVAAGADAIGFVFAESVRKVTVEQAALLCARVPAEMKRVAVMLHPSNDEWLRVLHGFGPDVLQTDAGDFATLDVPHSVDRWPVYRERTELPASDGTYVYEGARSGRGETVDWSQAMALARRGQMILAGGLAPSNIAEAIAAVQPFGVDVSSGVETAPGQKAADLVAEFVSAAKAAGNTL